MREEMIVENGSGSKDIYFFLLLILHIHLWILEGLLYTESMASTSFVYEP